MVGPTYTAAQAQRGEAVYQDRCSGCHGDQLDNGQFAPPLVGALFLQHWGGQGLDQPYSFMITQMPPDAPGGLGLSAYADLMAFIMSKNGVAASAKEMPSDPAALKQMAVPK